MVKIIFISFVLLSLLSVSAFAQQAIVELENDDTLPIASTRYDDAVEPPKDNFSSASKNDSWEKFERGELDQKAFIRLQEEYQAAASHSKDPFVKRKIASDLREKTLEEKKKLKEELAAKKSEEKKKAKLEKNNAFEKDMAEENKIKEKAAKKAKEQAKKQAAKTAAQKSAATKKTMKSKVAAKPAASRRSPTSTKKPAKKLPAKKK